jgi:uncharacterized protein (DUF2147 family)
MKRIFAKAALVALAFAVPASASAQEPVEGHWKNPKGSVTVKIAPCGGSWCGYVIQASEKAKQGAREGGTDNLIGTRILTGLKKTGDNTFRGQAFDPKRNIRAAAVVTVVSPTVLSVRGCKFAGLICREWRWTRAS